MRTLDLSAAWGGRVGAPARPEVMFTYDAGKGSTMTLTDIINEATKRATAKNPKSKQQQVSGAQARNLVRQFLLVLGEQPLDQAAAILAKYAKK